MREHKKITIVHIGDFLMYPPVISLIQNLMHNGIKMDVISTIDVDRIPEWMKESKYFNYQKVPFNTSSRLKSRIIQAFFDIKQIRQTVKDSMLTSDLLWTTTDISVKVLGDLVLDYKHVMQLMELIQRFPHFTKMKILDHRLPEYAQKAYKVVVPDLDRAYIQQAWWTLPEVPTILPNKPYSLNSGELPAETLVALKKLEKETRKILLYSGVIMPERNIEDFAKALEGSEDFVLYIIGRSPSGVGYIEKLLQQYPNIEYLGYHTAPAHLELIKYAYIGLTPYVPTQSKLHPVLNALYCAPNKIYEYSAFGVPMIGTNVLGLLRPFERYNIGRCAKDMTPESVLECVEYIDEHHDEMSKNCLKFFEKDNLDKIVQDIIEG